MSLSLLRSPKSALAAAIASSREGLGGAMSGIGVIGCAIGGGACVGGATACGGAVEVRVMGKRVD